MLLPSLAKHYFKHSSDMEILESVAILSYKCDMDFVAERSSDI